MTVLSSKQCGVYQIRNTANGKRYVGSAAGRRGFLGRQHNHWSCLRRGVHHNQYLQASWNKYGENIFVFEVIVICDGDFALELEQRYLDSNLFEYNIFPTVGDSRGYRHTKKTKAKMSAAHIGKKFSSASRLKMSESKRYGAVGSAKLTPDNVREVRRLLKLGITQADIASRFGVSRYVVTDIKRGRTWGYVK